MNYIEIGTNEYGTLLENDYFTGWGIVVEPVLKYFKKLPRKENVQYLNCALTPFTDGTIDFYEPIDSPQPEWVKSCGSVYPDHKTLKELGIKNQTFLSKVNAMSLDSLYKLIPAGPVHMLKIDTEGSDFGILNNWNFAKYKPMHLQFESKLMDKNQMQLVTNILSGHGYVISAGSEQDYNQTPYNHIATIEF